MKIEEVISLVMTELNRAEKAHPDWPKDDVEIDRANVKYRHHTRNSASW